MEDRKIDLWDGVIKPGTWDENDQESFPDPEQIVYLYSFKAQPDLSSPFSPNSICWSMGFDDERGIFGPHEVEMPLKDALIMASQAGWHISCGWGLEV